MSAPHPRARAMARRARGPGGQAGMTIVELLVALTVSLIGLAGLMSLFTVMARANAVSADSSQAVDIAAQMLEEMGTMSVPEIEAIPDYGPINSAGWGPVPYHLGDALGRRNIVLERNVFAREVFGSPGLVWIQAEVLWRDPGAPETEPARRITLERTLLREDPS